MVDKISRRRFVQNAIFAALTAEFALSGCEGTKKSKIREFRGGAVSIPELDVNILLPENDFYRVEYVADVSKRALDIVSQNAIISSGGPYKNIYGMYLGIATGSPGSIGHYLLVDDDLNTETDINIRCHENGHFIWDLNQQNLIYQKFKRSSYVESQVHDTEDFAILCGWVGLRLAGYDLAKARGYAHHKNVREKLLIQKRLAMEYLKSPGIIINYSK